MRKGKKEDLRIVHVALVGIAAFMVGYLYRSWQETSAPLVRQPPLERCGHTNLEPDILNGQLDDRPIYILPAPPAGKTGEYL